MKNKQKDVGKLNIPLREDKLGYVEDFSFGKAIEKLYHLSWPSVLNGVSVRLGDIIMLHAIGELPDPVYQAAAGLSNVWVLMVIGSPVFGFISMLDTVVSQSYGRREYEICGIYYNRVSVFSLGLAILLSPLAFFAGPLLKLFGIDGNIANHAESFATVLVFHMILWLQFVAAQKFLNSQKIVLPQLFIVVGTSILHPLWVYMFVFWLGFGYMGAAYARCLTTVLSLGAILIFIKLYQPCHKTRVKHSAESFSGFETLFKIGLPSSLMNCLGSWAYQIAYLISGTLGKVEAAANIALVNINMLSSTIYGGLATSASTLVGNSIGALQSSKAKMYIWASALLTIMFCGAFTLMLILFRTWIANFFSVDPVVEGMINKLLLYLIIELAFDNAQGLMRGILLGMGRQNLATIISAIVFYIVMLPAAYVLSFKLHYDIYGIWIALIIGYGLISLGYAAIVVTQNFEQLEQEAAERIDRDKESLSSRREERT